MPLWTLRQEDVPPELRKQGRLDKFVFEAMHAELGDWTMGEPPSAFSRSQVQHWIEDGLVAADGHVITKTSKVPEFRALTAEVPEPVSLELVPEDRPIEVLYEDADLVVVNKPPGLTVHPSETQRTGTLVHALLHQVKDLSGIGGKLRPGIVHRIDKDTSGALVITKTDRAHLALAETFAKHEIERRYWALCYGSPGWPGGKLRCETLIARHPTDRIRMSTQVKSGRNAVSEFQLLESYGQPDQKPFASLIEAKLETGRTHQVRVHLTSLHHSLLGDPLYGTPTSQQPKWKALPESVRLKVEALEGQALHARVLGFRHPVTGETLRFEAPVPPAFQALLDSLRRYR